jgi:hypothetical protein
MIRNLEARLVNLDGEVSNNIHWSTATVINGKADMLLKIETGACELELPEARKALVFLQEVVTALELTSPKNPGGNESKDETPAPKNPGNQNLDQKDLQIPFSSVTQKREYNNAWKLCRKNNLPYPEALKKKAENQSKKKLPSKTPLSDSSVLDARGNPLFVGAIVKQVLAVGKKIAAGKGSIKAISNDGLCHVSFPFNTKVLSGKHFELIEPGKKPSVVEEAKQNGDSDWKKILHNEPEKVEAT